MSQDQVERDRLLTEVHTNVSHMVTWTKTHETQDNERFKSQGNKIDFLSKCVWMGLGGLAALQFILKVMK